MSCFNQLIKLPALNFVGSQIDITNSYSANSGIIRSLWKKFNFDLHKIKNRVVDDNWEKFGFTFKINERYFYSAAIKFSDDYVIPSEFNKITLQDLEYMKFDHKGSLSSLQDSINSAFCLIKNNDEIRFNRENQLRLMMIEKYDNRFNWNSPNSIIEILIPVVRKL